MFGLVWLSSSILIYMLRPALKFLFHEDIYDLAICILCRVNDSSSLYLRTKITVRTTRNSRDQTGIVMGREIDTISKMGRELADIMEEEVKMRITEIEETTNLAGCSSDI